MGDIGWDLIRRSGEIDDPGDGAQEESQKRRGKEEGDGAAKAKTRQAWRRAFNTMPHGADIAVTQRLLNICFHGQF